MTDGADIEKIYFFRIKFRKMCNKLHKMFSEDDFNTLDKISTPDIDRYSKGATNEFKDSFYIKDEQLHMVRFFNVCGRSRSKYPNEKQGNLIFGCYPKVTDKEHAIHRSYVEKSMKANTPIIVVATDNRDHRYVGTAYIKCLEQKHSWVYRYTLQLTDDTEIPIQTIPETNAQQINITPPGKRKSRALDNVSRSISPKKQKESCSRRVIYNGDEWDSVLEAKHIVFLDALGIPWFKGFTVYIKESNQQSIRYTADIWLPTFQTLIEIKPCYPSEEEKRKCELVAEQNMNIILLYGEIGMPYSSIKDLGYHHSNCVKGMLWKASSKTYTNVVWMYDNEKFILDEQQGTSDTRWKNADIENAFKQAQLYIF